jgi:hypothetical protein
MNVLNVTKRVTPLNTSIKDEIFWQKQMVKQQGMYKALL